MGRIVLNKLRSRKGASITFALLAFLVCAVVGAVLLASASAAAGRLSGLAESDQRYYAVTSAAQLFCDSLDGQSFTIEQTSTAHQRVTSHYKYEEGSFKKNGSDTYGEVTYEHGLKIKAPYDITDPTSTYENEELQSVSNGTLMKGNSLLTEAALYYVFGDTINSSDAVNLSSFVGKTFGEDGASPHEHKTYPDWDMTLEVGEKAGLTVSVKGQMEENGDIELRFQNIDDSGVFSMIIVLQADVREPSMTRTERTDGSGSSTLTDELTYDSWVDTATDSVKTTVITWRVAEVKKVAA